MTAEGIKEKVEAWEQAKGNAILAERILDRISHYSWAVCEFRDDTRPLWEQLPDDELEPFVAEYRLMAVRLREGESVLRAELEGMLLLRGTEKEDGT